MPYKRKDSPNWWICYTAADGTYVQRSSGTKDKNAAKAMEQEERATAWREKQLGIKPPRTFEDVIKRYLQRAERLQRSYTTTLYRVETLRSHFAGKIMGDLAGKDIRAFIDARIADGAKNATINRELGALAAAINYVNTEYEWDLPNPVKGRTMREPEGRVRWITRQEVAALCRAARDQRHGELLEAFIRLAVNTGCRREEMLGLEWRRVDLTNKLIHLEAEHTKGGRRRSVPINQGAWDALQDRLTYRATHCPASPWVFAREDGERVKTVRAGFESACKTAGIENFHIHDLRHTFAAHLVSGGVPLAEVRDLLGHKSVTVTERYAHLAPARVRKAVEWLDSSGDEEDGSALRLRYGDSPVQREKHSVVPLKPTKGAASGG